MKGKKWYDSYYEENGAEFYDILALVSHVCSVKFNRKKEYSVPMVPIYLKPGY